jgi:nucleoside-diphosphate-sugar epimerase
MEKKTVLLLGATGLVGGHILTHLLNNEYCGRVVALTRSAIQHADAFSRLDARIVDFDNPDSWRDQVAPTRPSVPWEPPSRRPAAGMHSDGWISSIP